MMRNKPRGASVYGVDRGTNLFHIVGGAAAFADETLWRGSSNVVEPKFHIVDYLPHRQHQFSDR